MELRFRILVSTVLGNDPYNPSYIDPRHTEFDPKGQNVGTVINYVPTARWTIRMPIPIEGQSPLYIDGQRANVSLDGIPMSAQEFANYVNTVGVGGMIGLTQTLMSYNDIKFIGFSAGGRWFGGNLSGAIDEAIEMDTWTAYTNYASRNISVAGLNWRQPTHPPRNPWFINGFTSEQKAIIEKQVQFMYSSEACNKAFEAAGLKSVKSMMDAGSLVFVHERQLSDPSKNAEWLGDNTLRGQMLDFFKKDYEYNGVTPIRGYNGNYFVGLRDRAFTGWDNTPVHIIIHELIHAGGGEHDMERIRLQDQSITNWRTGVELRRVPRFRTPSHDLDWMNYEDGRYRGAYDNIIKKCTRR